VAKALPAMSESAVLKSLYKSDMVKRFRTDIKDALDWQWNGLAQSNLVDSLYDRFLPVFDRVRQSKINNTINKSSPTRRALNQAILSGKIESLDRFQRYVYDKVTGEMRKVGNYSGYDMSPKTYLYTVMEKGGQDVLNKYLGIDKVQFSLTNYEMKVLIDQRIRTLVKGVDDYTARRFSAQLIKGMENGESKKELVTRLMNVGSDISEIRAERIVRTETTAAVEYMRHETARLNGVQFKTWITSMYDVCIVCRPLHGQTVAINQMFDGGFDMPPIHINCFDKDTEVLTNEGWKYFNDIRGTEKCLSVDLTTLNSEWVDIKHNIKYKFTGNLSWYKNISTDIMVTSDHKHVVKFRKKAKGRQDAGVFKLVSDNELPKHDFSLLGTIPNYIGKSAGTIKIGDILFDTATFCEFLGYYLSEGSITLHKGHGWQINIAQIKHKEIMDNCAKKLFKTVWIGKKCSNIPIKDEKIVLWFKQLGYSYEKFIPDCIKELAKKYLNILLDAYILGDGHIQKGTYWKGHQFGNRRAYFTSSKRLADDIGELLLKIGKRPSYRLPERPKSIKFKNGTYLQKHTCWRIYENNSTMPNRDGLRKEIVPYNDYVYDVELVKYHTLFVRRNGKVLLSGNCVCHLEYDFANSLCDQYLSGDFAKKYDFYDTIDADFSVCANPEMVWKGGNGVIGNDKLGLAFATALITVDGKDQYEKGWQELSWNKLDELAEYADDLIEEYGQELYKDINNFRAKAETTILLDSESKLALMGLSDAQLRFVLARSKLTDAGFAQLYKKLKFRGLVKPRNFTK